jgi:hypothetical protein
MNRKIKDIGVNMDTTSIIILVGIWILNFCISAFNAIGVGRTYKQNPQGWMKLVLWSVIIMSVCGFTWCYLSIIALGAGAAGYLDPIYVTGALELGYLLIIFPILSAGLVMWVQSVATAYRQRTVGNILVVGWNTFAMVFNLWSAFKTLPTIVKDLSGLIRGGNAKEKGFVLMVVAVILAVIGGALTTYCLIKWSEKQR